MANPAIDLTGQTFSYLTVLRRVGSKRIGKGTSAKATWLCRCVCGKDVVRQSQSLRNKNRKNKSCGCKHGKESKTHGLTYSHPLYNRWSKIRSRCLSEKDKDYRNYGGRGITLCKRWHDFQKFVDDMYPTFQKGLTLDRIDNFKGYSKENCRWVTVLEQQNNTRTNVIIDTPKGKMTVAQASKEYQIKPITIYRRIRAGWTENGKNLLLKTESMTY